MDGRQEQRRRGWRSSAMFVRDHLAVVAHWARDQLREGVESYEVGLQLQRLIDAAEALRVGLAPDTVEAANVISLDAYRGAHDGSADYI